MTAKSSGAGWFNFDAGTAAKAGPNEKEWRAFMEVYGDSMRESLGAAKDVCEQGDVRSAEFMFVCLAKIVDALGQYIDKARAL